MVKDPTDFSDMEDQIKDMDYYKAAVKAAQNGQTAALEHMEAWKVTATHHLQKVTELEAQNEKLWLALEVSGIAILVLLILVLILA